MAIDKKFIFIAIARLNHIGDTFGGEAVCHTDPMMERTPEVLAIEDQFKKVMGVFPEIIAYHDFRLVAESKTRIILVADIDVREDVAEEEFEDIALRLEEAVMENIANMAYCSFYITPKFAY